MPELSVSRKNISKLLSEMQNKKFIIPDYQRPYKWDKEKCEILWNDIINFHSEKKNNEEYFLGTIVTCKSENFIDNAEIIDGQQRITSLFLLLRAFYFKLEKMKEDDNIIGLKNQIAPCLWDVDSISRKVKDQSKIHIESRVATENDNELFHNILEKGIVDDNRKDLYSLNYLFFYEQCEKYAKDNPMDWQSLCVTILEKCIVLPIECENVDTALTIFSTLNDRGMPLSDSDIFKAQIYRSKQNVEERKNFTDNWKELTESVEDAKISLDDLFRYYSHILRAQSEDKSKEIGLRKFYSIENHKKLKAENLVEHLGNLSDFWFMINSGESHINEVEYINIESRKYLHCLSLYPNEFWKYVTSVFFYRNSDSSDFKERFAIYLKQLTAFLFIKFIERPTVNAIKDDIYQAYIDVYHNKPLKFTIKIDKNIGQSISNAHSFKIAKALILLNAYQNPKQIGAIQENFEIEHIFPRVWQNTNYFGWEKKDADHYLEKFGNKLAIEKKINIQAGNGYFGKKKSKYENSSIADVIDLSRYPENDWVKEDIDKREQSFINNLKRFFEENLS